MAVRYTSIEAYKQTGELRKTQADIVYDYIRSRGINGACISEVRAYFKSQNIDIETNAVSRAMNDLKGGNAKHPQPQRIEFVDRKKSPTGKIAEYWRAKEFRETLF